MNDKIKWQELATHLMAVAVGVLQEKRDMTTEEYEEYEKDGDCEPELATLQEALENDGVAEKLVKAIYDIASGKSGSELNCHCFTSWDDAHKAWLKESNGLDFNSWLFARTLKSED